MNLQNPLQKSRGPHSKVKGPPPLVPQSASHSDSHRYRRSAFGVRMVGSEIAETVLGLMANVFATFLPEVDILLSTCVDLIDLPVRKIAKVAECSRILPRSKVKRPPFKTKRHRPLQN